MELPSHLQHGILGSYCLGIGTLIHILLKRKQRHYNNHSHTLSTDVYQEQLENLRTLLIETLLLPVSSPSIPLNTNINFPTSSTNLSTINVPNKEQQNTIEQNHTLSPLSNTCPWVYKVEGAANITFSFHYNSTVLPNKYALFNGLILRIKKFKKNQHPQQPQSPSSLVDISNVRTYQSLFPTDGLLFAEEIIRPLLGTEYIIPGISITLPLHCFITLNTILQNSIVIRPYKRQYDKIDMNHLSVVLMLDHTLLSGLLKNTSTLSIPSSLVLSSPIHSFPTLCFEIKPKAGIIPQCVDGYIYSSLYSKACRYCMHQISKGLELCTTSSSTKSSSNNLLLCSICHQHSSVSSNYHLCNTCLNTISTSISHYCPINLYSHNYYRIYNALLSLLSSPQNNFRIFENSTTIFTAEKNNKENIEDKISDVAKIPSNNTLDGYFPYLDNYLSSQNKNTNSSSTISIPIHQPMNTTSVLIDILTHILLRDPVLDKLKKVQELSIRAGNIEAVADTYHKVKNMIQDNYDPLKLSTNKNHKLTSDSTNDIIIEQLMEDYLANHPNSNETNILRDFLIAQTAKDVSLLIAVQINPCRKTTVPFDNLEVLPHSDYPQKSSTSANITSVFLDIEHMQRNIGKFIYSSPDKQYHLAITYSIAIVDVDKKLLSKIPYYLRQEQEIIKDFYQYGLEIFQYIHKRCGIQDNEKRNG